MNPVFARSCASFVLLALPVVSACDGGILRFRVHESIDEQLVEGSPLATFVPVDIPIDVDLAAETQARNTGPASHVFLRSLTLDITDTAEPAGDSDDFDFLTRVEIFAESTRAGSTLPRVRVAYLESVPRGVDHLSFDRDDVDLLPYVEEGARLTSEANGTVPPDDTTFDGDVAFTVHVF